MCACVCVCVCSGVYKRVDLPLAPLKAILSTDQETSLYKSKRGLMLRQHYKNKTLFRTTTSIVFLERADIVLVILKAHATASLCSASVYINGMKAMQIET